MTREEQAALVAWLRRPKIVWSTVTEQLEKCGSVLVAAAGTLPAQGTLFEANPARGLAEGHGRPRPLGGRRDPDGLGSRSRISVQPADDPSAPSSAVPARTDRRARRHIGRRCRHPAGDARRRSPSEGAGCWACGPRRPGDQRSRSRHRHHRTHGRTRGRRAHSRRHRDGHRPRIPSAECCRKPARSFVSPCASAWPGCPRCHPGPRAARPSSRTPSPSPIGPGRPAPTSAPICSPDSAHTFPMA